jgi:predicted ArsR family transcriptional regulator
MQETRLDTRFFESTRGRIVKLLRQSHKTVTELAAELSLTENGIRSHLLTLERDRLIEQKGVVKGFRKPHAIYGLTDEARHLFPKPYAFLLNKLLDVLKGRLSSAEVRETLHGVGREIASQGNFAALPMDARLNEALNALESMGGYAHILREEDGITISSESCPFDQAVAEHPEVCSAAESMIEGIVGTEVTEVCDRTASPKCRFRLSPSETG